jgi:hypothetical protein
MSGWNFVKKQIGDSPVGNAWASANQLRQGNMPSLGDIAGVVPPVSAAQMGLNMFPFLASQVMQQTMPQPPLGPQPPMGPMMPSAQNMTPEQMQLAMAYDILAQAQAGGGTGPGATLPAMPMTYEGAMANRFGSQAIMNQSGAVDTISQTTTPTEPLQGPTQVGQTRALEEPIEAEDMGPRRLTYQQVHAYKHDPKKAAEMVAKDAGVDPVLRRQFVKDIPDVAKQWYAGQKANGGEYDVYAFYDFLEGYLDGLKQQQEMMKQGS